MQKKKTIDITVERNRILESWRKVVSFSEKESVWEAGIYDEPWMQVVFLETDLQKGRNDTPDGVHSMSQGHRWTRKGGVGIGNSESSILAGEKYIDWSNRKECSQDKREPGYYREYHF